MKKKGKGHFLPCFFLAGKNTKADLVEFQVKTTSDAHIMLSPCYGCDGYEVVIGGWDNSKSVIRDKRGQPHLGCAATKVGCMQ